MAESSATARLRTESTWPYELAGFVFLITAIVGTAAGFLEQWQIVGLLVFWRLYDIVARQVRLANALVRLAAAIDGRLEEHE